MKAAILAADARTPGQSLEAAKVHEQFLRVGPNEPEAQEIRRRLVSLYLKYSDTMRAMATGELANQLVTLEARYRSALTVVNELLARGATDAGAHRLKAMALDGLAVPGNPEAMDQAVQEYRNVLSMDPGDLEAAERLSGLYFTKMKDTPRAERVLDDLLQAKPNDVAVRLCRHRFFVRQRRDDRATAELEAAARIDPDDVAVLVSSAEDAPAPRRHRRRPAPASTASPRRPATTSASC